MSSEDDLSDVSMADESDDSETENESQQKSLAQAPASYTQSATQANIGADPISSHNGVIGQANERDSTVSSQENRRDGEIRASVNNVNRNMRPPTSLPMDMWQHVLEFAPPKSLGTMLRVSKDFNACLVPGSKYAQSQSAPSMSSSSMTTHQPDEIWQQSRKIYIPQMPAPLAGFNELSMWQLAGNLGCEFCSKRASPAAAAFSKDQWHSGPGNYGVRPVWAFGIRACGPCLQNQVVKEIDLLLSSSIPSQLICALPFIFLTSELHVVASVSLQQGQAPSSIQITKYYLKRHVEELKKEYLSVQTLGSAATEEWIKGLDTRGKTKRSDIARWERWEVSNGLLQMKSEKYGGMLPELMRPFPEKPFGQPQTTLPPRPSTFHGISGVWQPSPFAPPTQQGPIITHYPPPPSHFQNAQRLQSPLVTGYGPFAPPAFGQPKPARTKEEADRLKAARRAEIERRCMELNPPITPNVLVHMSSFQAALHIIKPLDDAQWDMLKPRLLSQRADAQKREDERLAVTQAVQEKQKERSDIDDQSQETRDVAEREYEDAQVIVRNRVSTYADEIIRDGWSSGAKVNKENTPQFAAEVLIYVRKRFYAEAAKDDVAARAAGQIVDPHTELFSKKLNLENMRWVFETKVKPITDKFRKELFLCNGCETAKWYAFEGVCQHYASKHTASLSSGSVVVHWRAEWPEEPPFNPEPHMVRPTSSGSAHAPEPFPNGVPAPAPVTGFRMTPVQGALAPPPVTTLPTIIPTTVAMYQPPPVQAVPQMPIQYHLPYAPPQSAQYPQHNAYLHMPQPVQPPQYPYTHSSDLQSFQGNGYASSDAVPLNVHATSAQPVLSTPQVPLGIVQVPSVAPATDAQPMVTHQIYRTEAYKLQLQDLAATAKALWNETAGVKEMQGSVRVHLILFHMLKRLRETYTDDPPLSMFIDGIQNVKEMRIVRNVNGLACKICTRENANKPVNPHTVSSKTSSVTDRKLFSLPQLVNHYQSAHVSKDSPDAKWQTEMVELPEKKKIRGLLDANGMDARKIELLKEALPDAFAPDTPEPVTEEISVSDFAGYYENQDSLAPSKDKHEQYYSMPLDKSQSSKSPTDSLGRSLSRQFDPREDERRRPLQPSGGHLKRKADTLLDDRRRLGPETPAYAFNDQYRAGRSEYASQFAENSQYRMVRPEYDENTDLSRLLERAENDIQVDSEVVRPVEPTYFAAARPRSVAQPSRNSSRQSLARLAASNYARTSTDQYADDMEVDQRLRHETANTSQTAISTRVYDSQPGILREEFSSQTHNVRGPQAVERRIEYVDERGRPVPPPRKRSPLAGQFEALRHDQQPVPVYENDHIRRQYRTQPGRPSPIGHDFGYANEPATSNEGMRLVQSVQPQGARYADRGEVKYEDEIGRPASPTYASEYPSMTRRRPLSRGEENIMQEAIHTSRPTHRPTSESVYDRVSRPVHYQDYAEDAQAKPRPTAYQPEVEYVRMRDADGEYLVERPVRRDQPIYARYDEATISRPVYDDGRTRRPVYVDDLDAQPIRYVNDASDVRPIYGGNAGAGAPIYSAASAAPLPRYREDADPVSARMQMEARAIPSNQETVRHRQVAAYEDEQMMRPVRYESQGRQPIRKRAIQMPRDDPAYLEEYDPHNPTPLPAMPRNVGKY